MTECFVGRGKATPIIALTSKGYKKWLKDQLASTREWLKTTGFQGKPNSHALLPGKEGALEAVLFIYNDDDLFEFGVLPQRLPEGLYALKTDLPDPGRLALGWALDCYRFDQYKEVNGPKAQLVWPEDSKEAKLARAIYWVRDLINRPANDLTPQALVEEGQKLAKEFSGTAKVVKGGELMAKNFPALYAVGQAGATPHLLDMTWGDPKHPQVVLVGKGVCFDTGGLNLKPTPGIRLMKKDMGGAAHVLGLARLIMEAKLPIQLRVIVGAVENSVASNAMRPGDVLKTRKGLTVEVGNTDAEGRLVLADCLALAVEGSPDLIINFATLTGSARIALGCELPALFSNDLHVAQEIVTQGEGCRDALWPMPLWKDYARFIESKIADLSNDATSPYGGAITAALFLENFVDETPWVHIDHMAWNLASRPGRPEGGEAMGLRAVYAYLEERFG